MICTNGVAGFSLRQRREVESQDEENWTPIDARPMRTKIVEYFGMMGNRSCYTMVLDCE